MEIIESYNASYPLSYYSIGTVYSFYGAKDAKMAEPATDEQIRKYSNKLIGLEQEMSSNAIKPSNSTPFSTETPYSTIANKFARYYAVVVKKESDAKSTGIYVMFINKSDGAQQFLIKKYGVSHPVAFDNVDLMPVSTFANFSSSKGSSRIGQLTKAKSDPSGIGQLTHVPRTTSPATNSSSIGQLTHILHSNTMNEENPQVGGLTRSKSNNANEDEPRVGGLTRSKR